MTIIHINELLLNTYTREIYCDSLVAATKSQKNDGQDCKPVIIIQNLCEIFVNAFLVIISNIPRSTTRCFLSISSMRPAVPGK